MSVCAIVFTVFAATAYEQVWDEGVSAYQERNFPAAIEAFERLVDEGVAQEELFYNLGNAYYRNGQLGPAIANYERAWQIDPGVDAVAENLRRAVGQTERALPRPAPPAWEEALFFWHSDQAAREGLVVAAIAWIIGWVLLIVRAARPWPYLRLAAALALLVSVVFGASWWIKVHPPTLAVAAGERVPVRYGNRADETIRFELYEGDRVRVEQRRDGWARIRTADGERGWAEDTQLYFIGPPYKAYAAHRVRNASGTEIAPIGYTGGDPEDRP